MAFLSRKETLRHRSPFRPGRSSSRAFGNYTRLEEAMQQAGVFEDEEAWRASQTLLTDYNHGFDHRSWEWKDTWRDDVDVLSSQDVAHLGEHYLDGLEENRNDEKFQELEAMLDHYVRNDVDHLFTLADARLY